jgi:hypothetical protein
VGGGWWVVGGGWWVVGGGWWVVGGGCMTYIWCHFPGLGPNISKCLQKFAIRIWSTCKILSRALVWWWATWILVAMELARRRRPHRRIHVREVPTLVHRCFLAYPCRPRHHHVHSARTGCRRCLHVHRTRPIHRRCHRCRHYGPQLPVLPSPPPVHPSVRPRRCGRRTSPPSVACPQRCRLGGGVPPRSSSTSPRLAAAAVRPSRGASPGAGRVRFATLPAVTTGTPVSTDCGRRASPARLARRVRGIQRAC